MRTFQIIVNPDKNKKYAALCQYFKANTADSKCMYNTAIFYIRNVMTGIRKSPEERTNLETEVLHDVFTGIQKANEIIGEKRRKEIGKLKTQKLGNMQRAVKAYHLTLDPFSYPTPEKWFLSYPTLDAVFKFTDNPVYRRMNSQVNQNAVRKAASAWTGYFKSLKAYRRDPWSFTGKPRIPGYLKNTEYTAWFTSQGARYTESENGQAVLSFINTSGMLPVGKASVYRGLKYVKTEIKPVYGQYHILLTFDDGIKEQKVPKHPSRIIGLDPGVGNFLGVGNNFGAVPFIIRGGVLKSANQCFNKKRAKLLSQLTRGNDSQHSVKYSRQLNAISQRRESFLRDYFYKCAWYICRYAVSGGAEVLVLGHNEGQKNGVSMGEQSNQNFVSIPFCKFIDALKTVAAKCGIAVVVREESYTSQASLLDMDKIPTYKKGQNTEYTFSGKRKYRGLYVSKNGTVMNADINGACNIIRKEYPDAFQDVKDFSYLYHTTMSVGYKDLYRNARAERIRPAEHRYHKASTGSTVRNRYRSYVRGEYNKLWGTGKFVWVSDKNNKENKEKNNAA